MTSEQLVFADLIVHHARITTMDATRPEAEAVAIRGGLFVAAGPAAEVMRLAGPSTRVIDAGGRRVVPGLIDSHTHLIRGGLSYNLELRWDGLTSLSEAMRRLRERAQRTPPPQWVRVVGGWSEFQFAERRLPTLAELNEAAPDTPVFVLHLYDRALLNRAAVRALGMNRQTPDPPGGFIERDRHGEPTGLLVARPSAQLLYSTLARAPRLGFDDQLNSTRQFTRELHRLGVTSVIDAGGGSQSYPDDYRVVEELVRRDELTLRIAYNLFPQKPRQELEEFRRWVQLGVPGQGGDFYRHNGAGEMLVFSAADFEDFREPRPELPASMEAELEAVVSFLASRRWPFRLHATYEESIVRILDVLERVDRGTPLGQLRWILDHAETISERSIDRVAALGGGVAIQHRLAYQGEYFVERYGPEAARRAPPVGRLLAAGVPVGGGTDATRVASYNPWVALSWLVRGTTVGGLVLNEPRDRLGRAEALRLYTAANGWFSGEDGRKGVIRPGALGDLTVLDQDYFSVAEDRIAHLTSELTVVGGKVVHASGPFGGLAPPALPVSPGWSSPDAGAGPTPDAAAPGPPALASACACAL